LGLVGVGFQFLLLALLTSVSVDFMGADVPSTDMADGVSGSQWLALFCFRIEGYFPLLCGLWLLGLSALGWGLKDSGELTLQLRSVARTALAGWISFLLLNAVLFFFIGIQNWDTVVANLSIFFEGPAGRKLPQISFVPGLIPLLLLFALAASVKIRKSREWRFGVLLNLPMVLLVIFAEHYVNFGMTACEVISTGPGLRIRGVMAPIGLALLFLPTVGFVTIHPYRTKPIVVPVAA